MTREELKAHCERQTQQFERVEKIMPVTPNDWKRYEEHKLVLELLEQEPCDDAISRECNNCAYYADGANDEACDGCFADEYEHPNFKPKAQYCEDCISRQAVLEGVDTYINKAQSTGTKDDFYSFAELVVKALPPVTPQPKTGYWISWYEVIEEEWGTEHNPHCKCSECGTEVDPHTSKFINCCPVCGAKMVGYKKREEKE